MISIIADFQGRETPHPQTTRKIGVKKTKSVRFFFLACYSQKMKLKRFMTKVKKWQDATWRFVNKIDVKPQTLGYTSCNPFFVLF